MSKFRTTETPFAFLAVPLLCVQPSPRRGKSGRNLIFPAAVKARPQLYACARKAFTKRRSRQNLLNTLSFLHNKNFPPGRGFIGKGAHETRGNRLQNALFMRIVRAGTNFFSLQTALPVAATPYNCAPLLPAHTARSRVLYNLRQTAFPFAYFFAFGFERACARSRALHMYYFYYNV